MNNTVSHLRSITARFPNLPGVYLMKDKKGSMLYIGKARDLKVRVSSYINGGDGRFQISFLMDQVATIETIVCENEKQAFLLERDLIGKFKPKFNIRLKDDKAFLLVRIDEKRRWPRLELVRKQDDDNATYYGPFTFSYELKRILEVIKKVVPLRTCTDAVLNNRQRPCLEYQIKRCMAPCCLPVSETEYLEWVNQAKLILDGKVSPILDELHRNMNEASDDLRFEAAAAIRDRIKALEEFADGQKIMFSRGENQDAFALHREGNLACLTILRVRNGRIADTKNYPFSDIVVSDHEIIRSGIEQFYDASKEIPQSLVLPFEIPEIDEVLAPLEESLKGRIDWTIPQRGVKLSLLKLAELNARQYFTSRFTSEIRYTSLANRLAQLVQLSQIPRRIEAVDISNLQGSDIVGAIAVFFDGEPIRKEYKKYNITQQGKPDDFSAIFEVVFRRLKRGLTTGELPDLLIIDGGFGQLRMACRARDELGINLDIIALAKMRDEEGKKTKGYAIKPERLYVEWQDEPLPLDSSDALTHQLQRIRDEVHSLVINFHRDKRNRRHLSSVLDSVPGVGPERRKRLLKEYGGLQKIALASPSEVAKVGRMSISIAERVISLLRKPY